MNHFYVAIGYNIHKLIPLDLLVEGVVMAHNQEEAVEVTKKAFWRDSYVLLSVTVCELTKEAAEKTL